MALKTRTREIARTADFKENDTVLVQLPQDNLVRRLTLEFDIRTSTPSGDTVGTGVKNEAVLNLVKRIQVRLNGTDNIFDVDLRTYFHALTKEYGHKPHFGAAYTIPAANASSNRDVVVPIDFALIRDQISDYSALVPANLLDSFELLITWGAIGDLISTVNDTQVDSTTKCKIHVTEVYETTEDRSQIEAVISNLTKIYEGVEETKIDQAYTSYPADELPVDIRPVPARHLSHCLVALANVTDKNPDESNSVITDVKLENVQGGGESILLVDFAVQNRLQELTVQTEAGELVGVLYLNWADIRNGGLDNIAVDALKYKFLTGTPTASKENAVRIYKKYIPVQV